jgi:uncharacterized protein (TIGR00251 family)
MPRKYHLHDGRTGSALALRVTPRSSRNQIVGVLNDGTIKVHIAASPVDDDANKELLSFLSEVLGVSKSKIDIVAGVTGRDKLVSVLEMDTETAHQRILAHMD